MGMLFDKVWAVIKDAETQGHLTVEEALDVATRAPQALYYSMMEALAEAGEDPRLLLVQIERLHKIMREHLVQVAAQLRVAPTSIKH